MDHSEKPRFAQAMAGLAAIYSKDLPEILVEVYWDSLKRFDFKAVGVAFKRHYEGENGAFWPKPGDIITIIEGSSEDRSIEAWHKADEAVRERGPYLSVLFDDPVIMATIEQMGGWVDFCSSPNEEDHKFKGERFKKAYRANLKKPDLDYPSRLIGLAEANSNMRGIKSTESVALIGNPEKCAEVKMLGRSGAKKASSLVSFDDLESMAKTLGIEKK